ncbi:Uncharacterized protein Rs2_00213 [Raphanus sativus]|nr:Uncharacterized protein Rs2_00213 [Raphanus sativus]
MSPTQVVSLILSLSLRPDSPLMLIIMLTCFASNLICFIKVSKPLETSLDTSKETKNHYEDVQGTEMAKCEMDEKVINNKRAGFFYRKIQTCIKKILLCSSIPLRT